MIKCVIFDMDDTLYDELNYVKSGFWVVGEYLSRKYHHFTAQQFYDEMYFHFSAGNRRTVFNSVLEEFELPCNEVAVKELVSVYRGHEPKISLPEESVEVLEELKGKYKMALLTDGFMPTQALKVRSLGLEKYCNPIIYTEKLGRENWKPSVLGYEKILEAVRLSPIECVYVGDNCSKDFVGPNKLGMHSVYIARPCALHVHEPKTDEAKPEFKIVSLKELLALVDKIE